MHGWGKLGVQPVSLKHSHEPHICSWEDVIPTDLFAHRIVWERDLPESCPCCQRNCLTFQDHRLWEKRRELVNWNQRITKSTAARCKTCLITYWHVKSSVNTNSTLQESVRNESEMLQRSVAKKEKSPRSAAAEVFVSLFRVWLIKVGVREISGALFTEAYRHEVSI